MVVCRKVCPLLPGVRVDLLDLTVRNCILVGSSGDELSFSDAVNEEGFFNYTFRNCLISIDELTDPENFPDFFDNCFDCLTYSFSDTLFVNEDAFDFHLDTLSKVEGLAIPITGISTDIEDLPRDDTNPDIGAFEYQYE